MESLTLNISINFRVKILREEPHTQKTADAAVGMRTDNGVRTQETVVDMEA